MMRDVVVRNAKLVFPIALAQGTIYFTLNHFTPFDSQPLPLTRIDRALPFWPWTIWPYLIMIFAPIALPLVVRHEGVFRQAVWAYLVGIGLTLSVHCLWPTHIDRPDPAPDGSFETWAYRVLLAVDSPRSCFPSGHIVGPAILCWAFWRDGWRLGPWLLSLFPLFSLTILTTKQHYFWDLLGGYAMATVGIVAAYWLESRRRCQ